MIFIHEINLDAPAVTIASWKILCFGFFFIWIWCWKGDSGLILQKKIAYGNSLKSPNLSYFKFDLLGYFYR